jgi:hypothetical protein
MIHDLLAQEPLSPTSSRPRPGASDMAGAPLDQVAERFGLLSSFARSGISIEGEEDDLGLREAGLICWVASTRPSWASEGPSGRHPDQTLGHVQTLPHFAPVMSAFVRTQHRRGGTVDQATKKLDVLTICSTGPTWDGFSEITR